MLRREFAGRLRITHFFSRSPNADVAVDSEIGPGRYQRVESGRLTANRLASMLTAGRGGLDAVDEWYICGPEELTETVINTLTAHGVPDSQIHRELFVSKNQTKLRDNAAAVRSAVTVTLNNAITRLTTAGNESLLEAALRSGIDAPYSCSSGACGKCKAKLLLGSVEMPPTHTLTEADVADGWILTCQSRPVTEVIHVNYDGEQTRDTNRTGRRCRDAKPSLRHGGIRGKIRQRPILDDARRGGGVTSDKTSL